MPLSPCDKPPDLWFGAHLEPRSIRPMDASTKCATPKFDQAQSRRRGALSQRASYLGPTPHIKSSALDEISLGLLDGWGIGRLLRHEDGWVGGADGG